MSLSVYDEDILDKAREYAENGQLIDLEHLELDAASLAKPIRFQTLGTVAAKNGHDRILDFLFQKGVDLLCSVKLQGGLCSQTPLFVAVCNDKRSTVKLLLDIGADPCRPETDFANRTPIHQAILYDNKPLLELIWEQNSSFTQTLLPSGALTVVEVMRLKNSPATEGSLFDYVSGKYRPEALDTKDIAGFAAVHHAAQWNLKDHLQLLLRRGANPKLVDATGQTPLEIAISHGFYALAQYLDSNQGIPQAKAFWQSKQELADTTHNFLRIVYLRVLQVQAISVLASKFTEEKLEAFYDEKVAASIVGYVAKRFSIDVMRKLFPALDPIPVLQLALRALVLIDEAYYASQKEAQPDSCGKHNSHIKDVLQYTSPSLTTNIPFVQQATVFLNEMTPEELEEVSCFLSSDVGQCWAAAKRAVDRDVGLLLAGIALRML
jgi:ankyrin repeat protein